MLTLIIGLTSISAEDKYTEKVYTNFDESGYIIETRDDYLVIAGSRGNVDDAYISKRDKDGNIIWEEDYGGSDYDKFYSLIETMDGGFVVVGYTESTDINGITNQGEKDAIIVKYDKDGNLLW